MRLSPIIYVCSFPANLQILLPPLVHQTYKRVYSHRIDGQGGGSVQHGLSAAVEVVRIGLHSLAADEHYSLGIMKLTSTPLLFSKFGLALIALGIAYAMHTLLTVVSERVVLFTITECQLKVVSSALPGLPSDEKSMLKCHGIFVKDDSTKSASFEVPSAAAPNVVVGRQLRVRHSPLDLDHVRPIGQWDVPVGKLGAALAIIVVGYLLGRRNGGCVRLAQ